MKNLFRILIYINLSIFFCVSAFAQNNTPTTKSYTLKIKEAMTVADKGGDKKEVKRLKKIYKKITKINKSLKKVEIKIAKRVKAGKSNKRLEKKRIKLMESRNKMMAMAGINFSPVPPSSPTAGVTTVSNSKTNCGNLIRAIKLSADRIPSYLDERASLCCTNTTKYCSRKTSVMVYQPKGSEPFGNKPYYTCPICKQLDKIATMWDTKGTRGYPQKATDLRLESQALVTFQNDVIQYGNERKYFQGITEGRPDDAKYCKAQGLKTQLWNEGSEHKDLVSALNTAKTKGCF